MTCPLSALKYSLYNTFRQFNYLLLSTNYWQHDMHQISLVTLMNFRNNGYIVECKNIKYFRRTKSFSIILLKLSFTNTPNRSIKMLTKSCNLYSQTESVILGTILDASLDPIKLCVIHWNHYQIKRIYNTVPRHCLSPISFWLDYPSEK